MILISEYAIILFIMIGEFAEFEGGIICERVKTGMDKAKSKGKLVGRPKIPQYKISAALEMTENGIKYKAIVKKLEISKLPYILIKNKNKYFSFYI